MRVLAVFSLCVGIPGITRVLKLPVCARSFCPVRTTRSERLYMPQLIWEMLRLLSCSSSQVETGLQLWTVPSHLSGSQLMNLHKMMSNSQGQAGFGDVRCFCPGCLPAQSSPCLHVVPPLRVGRLIYPLGSVSAWLSVKPAGPVRRWCHAVPTQV